MKPVSKAIALILGLLCLACLAAPAMAADNYLVLRGGPGWADETGRTSGGHSATMTMKDVYEIDLAYGRRVLPWLRLELEVGYSEYKLDEFKGSRVQAITGKDKHLKGMINALADWKNQTAFTPFVGAGLGLVRSEFKTDGRYTSGTLHHLDDTDTVFGYQFMAGVSWAMAPNWELELMYRYFAMNDRSFTETDNSPQADIDGTKSSFVLLGLRFAF